MTTKLDHIEINRGKEGLFYLTSNSNAGLLIAKPTIDECLAALPEALAELKAIADAGPKVVIDYTNWRGERRKRTITPLEIQFYENQWHPGRQWLLSAIDHDNKDEHRDFAMKDIHSWEVKKK